MHQIAYSLTESMRWNLRTNHRVGKQWIISLRAFSASLAGVIKSAPIATQGRFNTSRVWLSDRSLSRSALSFSDSLHFKWYLDLSDWREIMGNGETVRLLLWTSRLSVISRWLEKVRDHWNWESFSIIVAWVVLSPFFFTPFERKRELN